MTELVWDGKYRDGKRVAPVRLALPMQTVETVNEGAQDRRRTLDLFTSGKPLTWRSRLIWGDKKYVLPSLLPEFAGKVKVIYIDPPFDTGADFTMRTEIPDTDETFTKEPSMIEQKAYRDTWGRGLASYLQWFYETAYLLRELLADDGTAYIHLDWRMVHYARVVLDELFGSASFQNEIIWQRSLPHGNIDYKFGASHDSILRYTKSEDFTWTPQYTAHREEYLRDFYKYKEPNGRVYRLISCINPNPNRPNLKYEWNGVVRVWKYTRERMQRMHDEGLIVYSKNGVASYKGYLDEMKGTPMQDIWPDLPPVMGSSREWVSYPTQKPEPLIERILKASSNEGDLVLDCFCGSGTTAVVAEKLGRRWIAADLGRFAVHTTRKRLLDIQGVKPFIVQNLGKYERQAWMAAEFAKPEDRAATEAAYRKFILDLYKAESTTGNAWLHGVKNGRMVHVGAVDSPVTIADVKAISREVWRASGSSDDSVRAAADILGWEFAFELNETAKQIAAASRVEVKFRRIPREVLEKAAVDQGDIQERDFFELRALSTKLSKAKRNVAVELTDFILPSEDLPDDVAKAVKHWSQWIDYWAVDWDFKDDTFHNQWQAFRTRQTPELQVRSEPHEYREPGKYTAVVKVIDILGNDTTKAIEVEVK